MQISARVENSAGQHQVTLTTGDQAHSIEIPPKTPGLGSSVSGGELLFLALATCYCNDIYREAAKRGIQVEQVQVEVRGSFGEPGEPASDVSYSARVRAKASEEEISRLMQETDQLAEIQNTLRVGRQVTLSDIEVEAAG